MGWGSLCEERVCEESVDESVEGLWVGEEGEEVVEENRRVGMVADLADVVL